MHLMSYKTNFCTLKIASSQHDILNLKIQNNCISLGQLKQQISRSGNEVIWRRCWCVIATNTKINVLLSCHRNVRFPPHPQVLLHPTSLPLFQQLALFFSQHGSAVMRFSPVEFPPALKETVCVRKKNSNLKCALLCPPDFLYCQLRI